jgi:hypothetical protein
MSERSYAFYPGATSLQRWDRNLLRDALEDEGFNVYEYEWWHFDYKDWKQYPILNLTFEQLSSQRKADRRIHELDRPLMNVARAAAGERSEGH